MALGAFASLLCSSSVSLQPVRSGSRWLRVACWLPVLLALACVEEDDPLDDGASTGGSNAGQGIPSEAGSGGGLSQAGTGSGGTGGASEGTAGSSFAGGSSSTGGSGTGTGGSAGAVSAEDVETGLFVGMTAAHNQARQDEMQDPPLPDLTWSNEIAEFSQQWADQLATQCGTLTHRTQDRYGENLATFGTTAASNFYTPEQAVDSWMSEKACWDYGTIRGTEACDQSCTDALHASGCGHYTQIIWRDTRRVGCGYSTCLEDGFNYEIWVCNYDPPGNYIGEAPY